MRREEREEGKEEGSRAASNRSCIFRYDEYSCCFYASVGGATRHKVNLLVITLH